VKSHEGGGEIRVCTSCAETGGLKHLVKGTALGNLTDLAWNFYKAFKASNVLSDRGSS
jgi:hypothetical protein